MTITHLPPRRAISADRLERAEIIQKHAVPFAVTAGLSHSQLQALGLVIDECVRELAELEQERRA